MLNHARFKTRSVILKSGSTTDKSLIRQITQMSYDGCIIGVPFIIGVNKGRISRKKLNKNVPSYILSKPLVNIS